MPLFSPGSWPAPEQCKSPDRQSAHIVATLYSRDMFSHLFAHIVATLYSRNRFSKLSAHIVATMYIKNRLSQLSAYSVAPKDIVTYILNHS